MKKELKMKEFFEKLKIMMKKSKKQTKGVKDSSLGHSEKKVDDILNCLFDMTLHNEYKEYECPICGKKFTGYGNNPWPVTAEGRCCDECNKNVVVPTRLFFAEYGISKKSIEKHNAILDEISEGKTFYFIPFVQDPDFAMIEFGRAFKDKKRYWDVIKNIQSVLYSSLRSYNLNLTDFEAELLMDDIFYKHLLCKFKRHDSEEKFWKAMLKNYRGNFRNMSRMQYTQWFWKTLENGRAKLNLSSIIEKRA